MAVNGVEIELGQRWRTRGGTEVTVTFKNFQQPFIKCDDQHWRGSNGEHCHPEGAQPGRDLVELLSPSIETSEADAQPLTPAQQAEIEAALPSGLPTPEQAQEKADEALRNFTATAERLVGAHPAFAWAYGTASSDFAVAAETDVHPYHALASVLVRAFAQASQGKGKERHARGDTRFEDQPMATINKQIGSIDGFIYQAHKKSLEALRLPQGRNVAEILGAINYLAGAVIALETWAKKDGAA